MTYLHDHNQLKEYFAAIHDVYCDKEEGDHQPSTRVTNNDVHGRSLHTASVTSDWTKKVESLENTISSLRHQLSETIKMNQAKHDKLRKVVDNSMNPRIYV